MKAILIGLVLIVSSVAYAADYTFKGTASDDQVLVWRGSVESPALTADQVFQAMVNRDLNNMRQERRAVNTSTMESLYLSATPAVRSQVNTLLGFNPQ